MNIFKFLSGPYRRRREDVLRLRQIKPRRRKLIRTAANNPVAAYMVGLAWRPSMNFLLTNIQEPSSLY